MTSSPDPMRRKRSMPVSIDLITFSTPGLHCCFRHDLIHGSYTLASGSCIMSMSNFIWSDGVYRPVMAATNPSPRTSQADDTDDAGVGMAHLTVVPTNFDATVDDDSDE